MYYIYIYIYMILYIHTYIHTYIHILNGFQPIWINNCWITLYPNPSIGKGIFFFQPILEEFWENASRWINFILGSNFTQFPLLDSLTVGDTWIWLSCEYVSIWWRNLNLPVMRIWLSTSRFFNISRIQMFLTYLGFNAFQNWIFSF